MFRQLSAPSLMNVCCPKVHCWGDPIAVRRDKLTLVAWPLLLALVAACNSPHGTQKVWGIPDGGDYSRCFYDNNGRACFPPSIPKYRKTGEVRLNQVSVSTVPVLAASIAVDWESSVATISVDSHLVQRVSGNEEHEVEIGLPGFLRTTRPFSSSPPRGYHNVEYKPTGDYLWEPHGWFDATPVDRDSFLMMAGWNAELPSGEPLAFEPGTTDCVLDLGNLGAYEDLESAGSVVVDTCRQWSSLRELDHLFTNEICTEIASLVCREKRLEITIRQDGGAGWDGEVACVGIDGAMFDPERVEDACGLVRDTFAFQELSNGCSLPALQSLVDAGFDVRTQAPNRVTALMVASRFSGDSSVPQYLIGSGAGLDEQDANGWTPLMWAAMNQGSCDPLRLLLESGADVEAKSTSGATAIGIAAMAGRADAVIELIDSGANLDARTSMGESPLSLAVHGNDDSLVVESLIVHGASVSVRASSGGSLLHAWAMSEHHVPEVLGMLLEEGLDIDHRNADGMTSLMLVALHSKNPGAVVMLLNAGSDVGIQCEQGDALRLASENPALVNTDAYWLLNDATHQ